MKNSEDLLIDLARLHRIRIAELELSAFQIWHRREVSPLVSKIWETAIERMHQRAGKLKTRAEITATSGGRAKAARGVVKNEPADRQTSSTEGREKSGENAGMAREMLPSKDHANAFP
jgi:hypothetical protein